MNSPTPRDPWSRLTAAARRVSDDRDTAAPYGFATRVTALAFSQERKSVSLFERFALRAVGVACLLALMSVAVNYSALAGGNAMTSAYEEPLAEDDAVAVLLDLSL